MSAIIQLDKIRHIHYYYLYLMISVLVFINYNVLSVLFEWWFLQGSGFSKRPVIWLIAFFLMHKHLNRRRLLVNSTSINDVIFLVGILLGVLLVKDEYSNILPTLLLISIWFYSTDSKNISTIFIVWTFLIFSLPYFFLLTPVLQSMAVFVVESTLILFDIPVLVQEFSVAIPRGQFEIEQSCSGGGYLANNLILLFFYSLLSKFKLKQYILAFISTVLFALVINWVRILIIVVVAHHWGFDVPFFVRGHQNLGWAVYIIFLFPFFYFLLKIDRMNIKPSKWIERSKNIVLKIPSVLLLIPIFWFSAS